MKTRLLSTVVAALLASACVSAQSSQKLVANVPFGFHVGSVILPAGEYILHDVAPNALRVSSIDRKTSAVVITNPTRHIENNEQPKLVFIRYGDQYFLSRIRPIGVTGTILREGRAVKEAALLAARHANEIILARVYGQ